MSDINKEDIVLGEGIWEQIQKVQPVKAKPFTPKDLEALFKKLEKQELDYRKKLVQMEKDHVKHFAERSKELGKEPPLWLMFITSPMYNKATGGTFYTSREFIEKYKEWF